MKIERALQIAKREWGNIGVSLERCGDIGEFNFKSHVNSRLALVRIETGDKFQDYNQIKQAGGSPNDLR